MITWGAFAAIVGFGLIFIVAFAFLMFRIGPDWRE